MSGLVRLAARWLAFHRGRTLLLVGCLALAFLLPITVSRLMAAQGDRMRARAVATPYVVGAPGSRYDLVVSSLWFRGRTPGSTSMREIDRVEGDGRGVAVPLLVRHSAGGLPLVGTSYDYFERRGLHPAQGRLPAILGEAVLGATAAERSGVGVDGHVLTDADGLLGMGIEYPVRLRVGQTAAPFHVTIRQAEFFVQVFHRALESFVLIALPVVRAFLTEKHTAGKRAALVHAAHAVDLIRAAVTLGIDNGQGDRAGGYG